MCIYIYIYIYIYMHACTGTSELHARCTDALNEFTTSPGGVG